MPSRSRTKFSEYIRRNAIALVALFFAVSGSTAMALDGSNTVFSDDIVNQEVTTADLAQASVTSGKLAANSVNSSRVVDDSLTSEDILDGEIHGIDVAFGTLRGDEILDDTISGNDIVDDGIRGEDVNESTLGQVPQASSASSAVSAYNANHAETLVFNGVYVRTASVVVPGGSQTESNGNGFSRAISTHCDLRNGINRDMAVGGGAFWSGNANSNSNELENRIHSAAFLDTTGDVATAGEFPYGYVVRGEVDKDGDDTLTVQVTCLRTFP